ncbi:hypothetical protein [Salinicola halimionae]|uniref:hypothetical protein n=1 Tax=Salinicola halimionae TaxID=1949081 RepID=UPI001300B903|nr:hypothetical protein [Salinicola halimionae]
MLNINQKIKAIDIKNISAATWPYNETQTKEASASTSKHSITFTTLSMTGAPKAIDIFHRHFKFY